MTAASSDTRVPQAAVLFLFAGIAVLLSLADRAPLHPKPHDLAYDLEYQFDYYLKKAVHQELPGPHAYRVLVPYAVAGIGAATGVAALTVDFLLKVLVIFALQTVFFRHLGAFFDPLTSLCGVALLDVYVAAGLSYPVGPTVIETGDLFNVLVFAVALNALLRGWDWVLFAALFVGSLNRETTWLLLPAVYLADAPWGRRLRNSLLATLMVALPYLAVRLMVQSPSPDWWLMRDVGANIPFIAGEQTLSAVVANLRFAVIFGPLFVLAFHRFREKQAFHRLAAAIVPLYILVHYLFGKIIEVRLWVPLLVVLIPPALDTLRQMLGAAQAGHSVRDLGPGGRNAAGTRNDT